ncbi:thiamine phosphate synthase [Salinimonas sp. HHU 13199]|uniref:Thiamine-phosphate synthase n=1 Tax=Salinimonas profundi TaxID=2729140 RepID=A0ABR8LMP2_9ALTE|nr:thiamine phosphate synthase [Salinimonas profundi]MBD3587463.1 thiamine phosphate synthase [Salinimonas profundi]
MRSTIPVIWCIGGLDISGGAGLTRDAATASALNCHAMLVATTLSAQSITHAHSVMSLAHHVDLQLQAVASHAPAAIKIAAVSDDIISALVPRLRAVKQQTDYVPVIWDPVLRTSAGSTLGTLSEASVKQLLAVVDVVTPNDTEMTMLSNQTEAGNAADWFIAHGAKAVVIKGGHRADERATDKLFTGSAQWDFSSQWHPGSLRGTGCMFATAVASFMARDYICEDAVCLAKALINQAFRTRQHIAADTSVAGVITWPEHSDDFPDVRLNEETSFTAPFAQLRHKTPGLYPVVSSCEWLELVLNAGVHIAQLRIKNAATPDLNKHIQHAVALGKHYNAQVFINDHWQLAIEHGAYGVHLGQEDLAHADLQAIANAGLRLGISTHGYAELCRALALSPSYVALGHVFATKTKQMPSVPQGLKRLASYRKLCGDMPSVAIGGISQAQVEKVWATGVSSVAMVSAITDSPDPSQTIVEIQHLLRQSGASDD